MSFFVNETTHSRSFLTGKYLLYPLSFMDIPKKMPLLELKHPSPFGHGACVCMFSCSVVSYTFVTPWTVAHLAPLSVGFPKQEHGSGLSFPPPGNLFDPRIKPVSPALQADFFNCLSHQDSFLWTWVWA